MRIKNGEHKIMENAVIKEFLKKIVNKLTFNRVRSLTSSLSRSATLLGTTFCSIGNRRQALLRCQGQYFVPCLLSVLGQLGISVKRLLSVENFYHWSINIYKIILLVWKISTNSKILASVERGKLPKFSLTLQCSFYQVKQYLENNRT